MKIPPNTTNIGNGLILQIRSGKSIWLKWVKRDSAKNYQIQPRFHVTPTLHNVLFHKAKKSTFSSFLEKCY